jgi:hypothetical protein
MSQIGQIISCGAQTWCQQVISNWNVEYTYQLDAGGIGQAMVIVGNGPSATVSPWASATSTVTVSPNPPGTTNPVSLPCPDLVQWATFGIRLKGFPTQ